MGAKATLEVSCLVAKIDWQNGKKTQHEIDANEKWVDDVDVDEKVNYFCCKEHTHIREGEDGTHRSSDNIGNRKCAKWEMVDDEKKILTQRMQFFNEMKIEWWPMPAATSEQSTEKQIGVNERKKEKESKEWTMHACVAIQFVRLNEKTVIFLFVHFVVW